MQDGLRFPLGTLCLAQSGLSAKTVITDRLLLEANRLLIHTLQSVKQIALQLGFEEAAYFNKFFKNSKTLHQKRFEKIIWQLMGLA